MKKGVDISSHNGEVDFVKLVEEGIDFCLIRLGYGNNEEKQDDSQFERNISWCEKLNIKFGIYIYSYALDFEDLESEIRHTERQLEKCKNMKNFRLGVWFDMEDADNYKKKNGIVDNNELLCDFCSDFCTSIEGQGYFTGIYANKYWLENKLNQERLDRFAKWVAQWNDSCTYNKQYAIWQNSNDLVINGKRFDSDIISDENYINYFFGNKEESEEKNAEELINEIKKVIEEGGY